MARTKTNTIAQRNARSGEPRAQLRASPMIIVPQVPRKVTPRHKPTPATIAVMNAPIECLLFSDKGIYSRRMLFDSWRVEEDGRASLDAHLSDDQAVAKMGHRIMWGCTGWGGASVWRSRRRGLLAWWSCRRTPSGLHEGPSGRDDVPRGSPAVHSQAW